ncbi:hypothetical protein BD413DRAFT_479866 [Trametes elegans]|nr:hypothetical protein BD413DRAFT_479866 [Trametes elegans]
MSTSTSNSRTLSLVHLPVELLYEIYTVALSPTLPLTCKHLHAVFKSASPSLHAQFLIRIYEEWAHQSASARAFGLINKVLRYPICTPEVLEAILRSPNCPYIPPPGHPDQRSIVLPRHLFRNMAPRDGPGQRPWTEYDHPLPFLKFLYADPRLPPLAPNSHQGYALTRAVFAGFTPLIQFLLARDAWPGCKDNLAVLVAIRRKSLPLVRMLLERDMPDPVAQVSASESSSASRKRRRSEVDEGGATDERGGKKLKTSTGKRRKLGDRLSATPDMLKEAVKRDAHDIAEYLMREKGCVPDMQTVLMMGSR